jgi:hypothetical protein
MPSTNRQCHPVREKCQYIPTAYTLAALTLMIRRRPPVATEKDCRENLPRSADAVHHWLSSVLLHSSSPACIPLTRRSGPYLASPGSVTSSKSPSFPSRAYQHKTMRPRRTPHVHHLGYSEPSATSTASRHCFSEECDRCSTRCKEEDGQQAAVFGIRGQEGSQSV